MDPQADQIKIEINSSTDKCRPSLRDYCGRSSRKQPAYFRIVPALNLLGKIRQFTLVNTNRLTHFEND